MHLFLHVQEAVFLMMRLIYFVEVLRCMFLPAGEVEGEGSPDLAISEYDYSSLDGMKVGPLSAGEIGPFSSTKLEIIWQPTVPGKVDTEFLVTFTDPLSDGVSFTLMILSFKIGHGIKCRPRPRSEELSQVNIMTWI